jgi:WD40 repeat protein
LALGCLIGFLLAKDSLVAPAPAPRTPVTHVKPDLTPIGEHGPREIRGIAFTPDGKTLAVAGGGQPYGLLFADVETDCLRLIIKKDLIWVYAFAFSADGKRFATGHAKGGVHIWDTATCRLLADLKGHDEDSGHHDRVEFVAFSPNGEMLATGGCDDKVILWDIGKQEARFTIRRHSKRIRGLAFSPDGKTLATTGGDGTLRFTNTEIGEQIASVGDGERDCFDAVAYSPDGRRVACANADEVSVWDAATLKRLFHFKGYPGIVLALAFSPNGNILATGSQNDVTKLWNMRTGKIYRTIKFSPNVNSLTFSPDSRVLAAGGDTNVKLWDVATGKEYGPAETDD